MINFAVVIDVYRQPGGPEEGGWYYDRGIVEEIVQIEGDPLAEDLPDEALDKIYESSEKGQRIIRLDDFDSDGFGVASKDVFIGADIPLQCSFYC